MGIEWDLADVVRRNEILEKEVENLRALLAYQLNPNQQISPAIMFAAQNNISTYKFDEISKIIRMYVNEMSDPALVRVKPADKNADMVLEIDTDWVDALNREARSSLLNMTIDGPYRKMVDAIADFNKILNWMMRLDEFTILEGDHMQALYVFVNTPPQKGKR